MAWIDKVWRFIPRIGEMLFPSCPEPPSVADDGGLFLVVGHRGSPGRQVENTIPSFEFALRHEGVNAVEADICLTRDGEVVLWHDWDPDSLVARLRQRGWERFMKYRPDVPSRGPFRKRTSALLLEEIREHFGYKGRLGIRRHVRARIPTLGEFLAWARNETTLRCVILDVKLPGDEVGIAPRLMEGIQAALEEHPPAFKVVLNTTELNVLHALKALAPRLEHCLDVELPYGLVTGHAACCAVPRAIELGNAFAALGRPTFLTLAPWRTYTDVVIRDVVQRARHNERESGKKVEHLISWTINNPREMKCLLSLGVTGMLTDRARRLRKMALRAGKRLSGRSENVAAPPLADGVRGTAR